MNCCQLHTLHLEHSGLFSRTYFQSWSCSAAFTLNLSPFKWIKSSFSSRFGLPPHILGSNWSTRQSRSLPYGEWTAWKQNICIKIDYFVGATTPRLAHTVWSNWVWFKLFPVFCSHFISWPHHTHMISAHFLQHECSLFNCG